MAKNYPPNYNWGTGAKPHTAGIDALPKVFYRNGVAYPVGTDPFSIPRGKPLTDAQMRAPIKNQIGGQVRSTDRNVTAAQKEINREVIKKAPKHATIISNIPSTCLASLSWKDGIATAEFYRGGQIVYDFPMSKEDFIDWINSDSIGKFGNAEVFD